VPVVNDGDRSDRPCIRGDDVTRCWLGALRGVLQARNERNRLADSRADLVADVQERANVAASQRERLRVLTNLLRG
jgi:hypothetical protein